MELGIESIQTDLDAAMLRINELEIAPSTEIVFDPAPTEDGDYANAFRTISSRLHDSVDDAVVYRSSGWCLSEDTGVHINGAEVRLRDILEGIIRRMDALETDNARLQSALGFKEHEFEDMLTK